MGKLKLAELIILIISSLANAAKAIIKVIDYFSKIKKQSAVGMA